MKPFHTSAPLGLVALCGLALTACGGNGNDDASTPLAQLPFEQRCSALVGRSVGGGVIEDTTYVRASASNVETCSAKGRINAAPTSAIQFVLDLPTDSAWNTKFIHRGGGGYNGSVSASQVTANAGFATVATDTGHVGDNLGMAWALNNPSAFDNFAYAAHPAVYTAAMDGIVLVYGKTPSHRYFIGGSTGGREALLQAQRYPDHYDGIAAHNSVVDYSIVNQKGLMVAKAIYANGGAGWMSAAKIKLYAEAQMAVCDPLDGLVDGMVNNIDACHYDAQALRCPEGLDTGDSCLSDAQIEVIRIARSRNTLAVPVANGITTVPAYGVGAETVAAAGWAMYLMGQSPNASFDEPWKAGVGGYLADQWLKYAIAGDPKVNLFTYTPGEHASAWLSTSEKVNSTHPDLSAFHARGGKLLITHGTSDHLVPAGFVVDYYESVVSRMGKGKVDEFVRLYLLPNAGHGVTDHAAVNNQSVLDDWVSNGKTPEQLVGQGSNFTRPVCRYPAWPKYNGTGNPSDASSFRCVDS